MMAAARGSSPGGKRAAAGAQVSLRRDGLVAGCSLS